MAQLHSGETFISQSLTGAAWQSEASAVSADVIDRYGQLFAQNTEMPLFIASMLASRGITPDTIEMFLEPRLRDLLPNPSAFKDMDKACALLAETIIAKKPIGIFGDYDVDGACSAAIFHRFLQAFGVVSHIHIPDRFTEGYGPNITALQKLKSDGAELLVTVDCGITAHRPLADADEMGMKVIVIDHHQAGASLPRALAVVNPNRLDDESGQGALCAASMVFMTCVGTMRTLREQGYFDSTQPPIDLLTLLDLVGMATICDIVPLTALNRAFVKQGLKILKKRQNVGLRHLADQARLNTPPTAHSFGFLLGPRINAGGRIGNASLGAKLLSTHDDAIAMSISLQLDDLNKQRKTIEADIQSAAMRQAEEIVAAAPDTKVLIVSGIGWHEGVIGIVAGRLKDHFHRPCVVIAFDENGQGKGSARGIHGFSLGNNIMAAHQAGLLLGGGGHAMPAGLSVAQENLEAFKDFMNEAFEREVGALPPPMMRYTMQAPLSACQKGAVDWLDKCAPFGPGFSEPRLLLRNVTLAYPRWIGAEKQHFSVELRDGTGAKLRAICFNLRPKTSLADTLEQSDGQLCHVIGKLKADDYRGGDAIQFMMDDLVFAS